MLDLNQGYEDLDVEYWTPGPTIERFHASDERRRLMMGPVGSGKSVAGCWEVIQRGMKMPVCIDGVRRGRYAVVRNTFGDLERTTIKTWCDQFEHIYGKPVTRKAGIVHDIHRNMGDGTKLELEVMFFSMDRPEDVKRLLSYEISGAFVNEAREIPKAIFEALDDRVTRYPSRAMLPPGVVPFFGWWADTNPPDKDSWIYATFEEEKPEGWVMFRQPGGLIHNGHDWVPNPEAENLFNLTLGEEYYNQAQSGKGEDHIRVYYGAQYGYVKEGRLVIGDFTEEFNSADVDLEFDTNIETVYVGIDFGATPAAAFLQLTAKGQWRCIKELQALKTGTGPFAKDMLGPAILDLTSRGHRVVMTGDPAGSGTSETDGRTPFKVLADAGLECNSAYSNAFNLRMEILRGLCREAVEGKPKFLLSKSCKIARRGLAQKFVFKRVGVPTDEGQKYQTLPDKNEFSHIIDAIIYGIMGSGYGQQLGQMRGGSGALSYPKLN